MNGAELKATLKAGGRVFGTMLSLSRNPRWLPVLDGVGLDYAVIDTEHGARIRGEVGRLPHYDEHHWRGAHRPHSYS